MKLDVAVPRTRTGAAREKALERGGMKQGASAKPQGNFAGFYGCGGTFPLAPLASLIHGARCLFLSDCPTSALLGSALAEGSSCNAQGERFLAKMERTRRRQHPRSVIMVWPCLVFSGCKHFAQTRVLLLNLCFLQITYMKS